ncbi:hypothetical protein GGTG_04223 [Gaeumannomyces tritici R3-111a-1]|uniref:Heterokaryon incompatibility domain-containing protein n=1 Tax=Gaeumannomyces tritici (strain R3-111a-1) TaxID=644352 RepID=J3NSH1_GAET3|nr:hypothetical protein GGTG_04223 [Gaeumannomyces tritici R3-111a-1]EJT79134.1 hypothetical protein GGTG_04223 [Gaeumannomyces tritici R3-111a-1]
MIDGVLKMLGPPKGRGNEGHAAVAWIPSAHSVESTSRAAYLYHAGALTPNLNAALMCLRRENSGRSLWVDAICIDQANNEENNHQVGQMGTVYSSAGRVLFWLGPSSTETQCLLGLAEHLHGKAVQRQPAKGQSSLELWRLAWDEVSQEAGEEPTQLQHARTRELQRPLDRAWFRRVWVVQEVALAKRVDVVCGRLSGAGIGLFPSARLYGGQGAAAGSGLIGRDAGGLFARTRHHGGEKSGNSAQPSQNSQKVKHHYHLGQISAPLERYAGRWNPKELPPASIHKKAAFHLLAAGQKIVEKQHTPSSRVYHLLTRSESLLMSQCILSYIEFMLKCHVQAAPRVCHRVGISTMFTDSPLARSLDMTRADPDGHRVCISTPPFVTTSQGHHEVARPSLHVYRDDIVVDGVYCPVPCSTVLLPYTAAATDGKDAVDVLQVSEVVTHRASSRAGAWLVHAIHPVVRPQN